MFFNFFHVKKFGFMWHITNNRLNIVGEKFFVKKNNETEQKIKI